MIALTICNNCGKMFEDADIEHHKIEYVRRNKAMYEATTIVLCKSCIDNSFSEFNSLCDKIKNIRDSSEHISKKIVTENNHKVRHSMCTFDVIGICTCGLLKELSQTEDPNSWYPDFREEMIIHNTRLRQIYEKLYDDVACRMKEDELKPGLIKWDSAKAEIRKIRHIELGD